MGTRLKFLFSIALIISTANAFTTPTQSLVVSSTEPSKEESHEGNEGTNTKEEEPVVPKIYEMSVKSDVANRFCNTSVASKVKNLAKTAQEVTFSVVLPETAYISGFVMEIDGKSYKAYVKEKEEAKQIYTQAIEQGQAAAHVEANARDSNRFTVSVNVEPQSKALFTLTYEELLQRQNGQYEIVINIHPGQPVKDLNVEVNINESRPLKFVKSPALRSGNEISKNDDKLASLAEINIQNDTTATVKFNPTIQRQKQLAAGLGTKEENGLAGQFVVEYDVERDPHGGEVLLKDGYFVHFFAPSEIQPLPKQVVFILDTSGSMDGIRIKQLKEAMNSILGELKKEDVFSIVEFSSTVKVWNVDKVEVDYELGDDPWPLYAETQSPQKVKNNQTLPPAYEASEDNINKAKQVVSKLSAYGGTDIKSGLEVGLKLVHNKEKKEKKGSHQPIIVFLTDGEPTVGETYPDKITSAISEINAGPAKAPIFSLSFGDGADRDFLQKISLKNLGFARHIYEGADASLQLQEFYKQISSPLLNDVSFKYVSNVTKLTKTDFPIFFRGSELVVAGVVDGGFVPPEIQGTSVVGPIRWTPTVVNPVGALERLWAYLTVKQILEARDAAENKTEHTKKALDIALKYSFVTPVSSLVVVKPNDTRAVDTQDASKTPNYPIFAHRKFAAARFPAPTLSLGFAGVPAYAAGPPSQSAGFASYPQPIFSQSQPAQSVLAEISLDSDDFVQPAFPSTPVVQTSTTPQATSTVTATIDTNSTESNDPYEEIKEKLPWLNAVLSENGTLKTPSGDYQLATNETITQRPECPKTPLNGTTGVCTPLVECPQIFPDLKDVQTFNEYFCPLDTFVGVCCPSAKNQTVL